MSESLRQKIDSLCSEKEVCFRVGGFLERKRKGRKKEKEKTGVEFSLKIKEEKEKINFFEKTIDKF